MKKTEKRTEKRTKKITEQGKENKKEQEKKEVEEISIKNESTNNEEEQIKKTDKKVTIFNFVLIVAIFIGLTTYMFCVDGIENIIYVLQNVNYGWVLARCWLFTCFMAM